MDEPDDSSRTLSYQATEHLYVPASIGDQIVGLIIGVVVGFLVGLMLAGCTGAWTRTSHGSFALAYLFFPVPMTLASHNKAIELVHVALALLQFPIYGILIGLFCARRRTQGIILWIVTFHIASLIAAYMFDEFGFLR